MSISMLSAPSAFKPTLVSDYFFNEPPSPLPHSFTHDVHLSSSPELESPTGAGSNHAVHAGFKKSEIAATIPEEEQHHDAGDAEEDVVMEITTEAEHVPSPSRAPHPSNDARDVSMTDVSTAKSSEAESSTSARTAAVVPCEQVSAHCARIHQNLMNAAMAVVPPTKSQAPHPQQQPQQQVPPPPMQPQERKYSASTTSTMVSAPSTAPNSHGNSPVSPCSDAAMSTSVSASGTPSPPPLRLPQAAQAAMAMNLPPALMPADQQSQPQQQQQHQNLTPKPSPPRSVPSAVSQLTPVAVPPHTTPAKESSSTYHQANTQHAQTPHQPSRREHHHHHHHSTHSNPTTPPTHTRAHHHSNAVVPASQPSTSSSSSSAAAALASRTPENVEYVGPFILGPVLGRGCTGTVRLGTHKRTGFECAFKIIEKKTLASNTDGTHSALWAKVKREIAILKLIEHKHVLKLYDVLETENRLYLVLEKSERGELFDYIVSKGRLDRHESLRITAQIIMGLEHCHSFSICHRDLKPENLLLDNKNNIKIADFGMAQLMKKDGFLKTSCGSPHYASPEIIEGVQYDARCTDVWSCGVILFALITGSLPFDHDNIPTLLTMVTKGHYTTPAHVPADIAHLISRMLTVDPVKRITLPEIRRHICFKGKGYFNEPKSDGLSIESVARGISAPQVGPAWKSNDSTTASTSQKRTKVSSREHLSHPPQTNFDHEEGEPQEHAWRKTRDSKNTALVHTADAKDLSPPNQPPFLLQTGSVATTKVHHPPQEEIDEAVLNDLESLGLGARDGNRDDLRRKIRSHGDGKEPSLEQVFYKLLKQRKQDRLKQLEVLSPKVGPQPPRVRRQSSHRHSSHTTGSVPSSRQGSNLNSPTGQQTAGGELTELTLPPPHPRSSPSASNQSQQDDSVMSDVTQSTSSSTQPASSSTGTGTSMYQPSTQFAGAGAFAATLFDMAAGENKSSSTSTTTKESLSRDAISVDVMRTSPDVTVPAGAVPALPMGSPPAVIAVAPPPMIHCFSDGSVPPSILQTDDSETAASYYLAMAASAHAPPPLILSSSNSQGGTSSGVEELPPSPSPSSSCSSLSRTGPSTPMAMDERMSQSAYSAYGGTAESPALPPQSSSSANVSPALTHREKLSYARRMSTPQATGREQVYQSGPARRLFADDDSATETPHRSNQQRALDEYSQRMVLAQAAAAAPASEHMMDVDSSEAIAVPHEKSSSMPMQPRDALMSPPLLALPKHASGPHIRVPLQTSESSGSEEETTTEVARPRPRAYSQDEANLLNTSMHHRPTDRILSNVRTPVVHGESPSELPSYGGHSHVGYTTSPRFHRVRIEEQPAAAGGAGLSSGAAGHAGGSTRTPMGIKSSQHANPPSPQNSAKRSWFSSVFGNTSFGLFDRLKGNSGSSNGGGEKNAASKHHESPPNRIQAPYAQNISGSPSPILSPASANSQGVRTKRATLTLANELTKVFAQTGVSFLHNGGYRFIGSHIGATSNLPEHHVLPPKAHSNSSAMPPQMPLMQRAVSEPECEQSSTIRPRSKSIAVESSPCSPKDSREDDSQMYSVRDRTQPVPSTPKPTPTRALNQPIQLQSLMQYPNVSPPHQDSRDHTRPSFDRTDSNSSGSGNESSGSISNSVVSQNYFSATGTSSSASSSSHPPVVGSPPGSAARSKNNTAIALFGPSAVRFAVDISELPGDMRLITLTRKSGDPAAFERIQAFVREKLRLVEGSH